MNYMNYNMNMNIIMNYNNIGCKKQLTSKIIEWLFFLR